MDRSATPWRVLDDTATTAPAVADDADGSGNAAAGHRPSLAAIGGLVAAGVFALGAFALAATSPGGEVAVDGGTSWAASEGPSAGTSTAGGEVVIDVQGAVLHPGVLRLVRGSRIGDAIAAAGGYGPRVDADRAGRELNLAAAVSDGDRIVVPSRDDPQVPASGGGAAAGSGGGGPGGLIDLNAATATELDALPGVGPVTAQKIIDARPFASVDELRDKKVVGSSVFEKIRDLVTVH